MNSPKCAMMLGFAVIDDFYFENFANYLTCKNLMLSLFVDLDQIK